MHIYQRQPESALPPHARYRLPIIASMTARGVISAPPAVLGRRRNCGL